MTIKAAMTSEQTAKMFKKKNTFTNILKYYSNGNDYHEFR